MDRTIKYSTLGSSVKICRSNNSGNVEDARFVRPFRGLFMILNQSLIQNGGRNNTYKLLRD